MLTKKLVTALVLWFVSSMVWAQLPVLRGIGGDFTLTSSRGDSVSLSDFSGKVVLIFFGYTNCADICPTTMAHVSRFMKRLPEDKREQVQVLFISFDTDFDTPEHMNNYLSFFDPSFIGLTGQPEAVAHVVEQYGAEFTKLAEEKVTTRYKKLSVEDTQIERPGYLYSHTAKIYVIDPRGRTRGYFYNGTPLEQMKADVLSLL